MQAGQPKLQEGPNDAAPAPAREGPANPVRLALMLGLMGVMVGVFFAYARSSVDWEYLQTKHYWSAETWYYGGYAGQYFETPGGYRAFISEGLSNYTNIPALEEQVPAAQARHPVQGFPGTERLASPFLVSALLHLPGETADVWRAFWQANVLLWILSVYLAYKVAGLYFNDRYSPWFAAILVALYPALTLTFNAIKQQPLGTTYLLLGIYLFEGHLRWARLPFKVVALAAIMFFGQFANGGWCFLAAFIVLRSFWIPGRQKWSTMACTVAAVAISGLWLAWLRGLYHLPSAMHTLGFSGSRVLGESGQWVAAWVAGRDVSGLRLLNLPGFSLFIAFWPVVCRGFLSIHTPLVLVAIAGLFLAPRSRMFTFLVVPMLFVAHSGVMLAEGWIFHYGYLSFPAAIMVILAASGVLGNLAARPAPLVRIGALAALALACWCFTDLKKQAGVYYGGDPDSYRRNIEVHYGRNDEHSSY